MENIRSLLTENGQFLLITPLIYPGIEYTKPNTKGIAVDVTMVDTLLEKNFSKIDLLHKDYLDDNGVLGYYLCSK